MGTPYSRPFTGVEFPETDAPVHTVLAAEFVTTEDGSGIVHEAPAFGAEDLALCRTYGLPVVNPLRPDGTFDPARFGAVAQAVVGRAAAGAAVLEDVAGDRWAAA